MADTTSRRDFLRGVGTLGVAAAATGLLAGCATAETDDSSGGQSAGGAWDKETDVLVIGGGVGGTMAAYVAAKGGAKTILVEAGSELGGTALISGGGINRMISSADMLPSGDQELCGAYVSEFAKMFDGWMVDTGAPVEILDNPPYNAFTIGTDYLQRKAFFQFFHNEITASGAEVILDTKGMKLYTDEEDTVIGARIIGYDGTVTRVKAKVTVLACGGYANDMESRTKYLGPWADRLVLRCVPHNTGDGLRMATEVGAQTARGFGWFYGNVNVWPALVPEDPAEFERFDKDVAQKIMSGSSYFTSGLFINHEGNRFCDESESVITGTGAQFGHVPELILRQPGGYVYTVLDAGWLAAYQSNIDLLTTNGLVPLQADTIEGLADELAARGVNREGFLKTIAEYRDAGSSAQRIPKTPNWQGFVPTMESGPFMAIAVTGSPSATFGGVKINTKAQVLSTVGTPIPGLLATPCCAGGFFYNEYGGSLGVSTTFGKVAGETALTLL
jgi:succinate dehydrogenase/fumarate reductase flavoprotein subunit